MESSAFAIFLRLWCENKLGRRWSYQPGVIDNFLFQLIGSPAGITQGDKIVFRTGAESDVGKNVDGGRNRNSVADDNAVAFEIIGGMQNKTTHLVQRATLIKVYGGNGFKRADRQLIGQIGEGELFNFLFTTKPIAPSFVCEQMYIKDRSNRSSAIFGIETRHLPVR